MEKEEDPPADTGLILNFFSQVEIEEGLRHLIKCADSFDSGAPRSPARTSGEKYMELIIKNDRLGAASIKPANLVVSWRKLFFVGGAIPASYMSSTLTAMTILGALVRGVVHVFDEIDARILAVIHQNSEILPASTEDFYVRTSMYFPPSINKALFMERVVNLSGYGAISVDCDQLRIAEPIFSIRL
ncbi:hypothetical protein [Tabrizicola sp. BL-A-41-H6]|uniref:hypothetical protein n=1 Tax=Tabrizicola sp. BL-A-41-H6 TaxID=3421107 RepID=UPI003D66D1A3